MDAIWMIGGGLTALAAALGERGITVHVAPPDEGIAAAALALYDGRGAVVVDGGKVAGRAVLAAGAALVPVIAIAPPDVALPPGVLRLAPDDAAVMAHHVVEVLRAPDDLRRHPRVPIALPLVIEALAAPMLVALTAPEKPPRDAPPSAAQPGGSEADSAPPDGSMPDSAPPDSAPPDSAPPDGSMPGASKADAVPPDRSISKADAVPPDGSMPGVSKPEPTPPRATITGTTTDLSLHGLRGTPAGPFEPGAAVAATVTLADGARIRLLGEVVARHADALALRCRPASDTDLVLWIHLLIGELEKSPLHGDSDPLGPLFSGA
ncbi:MAG: hypothetical protein H6705_10560 [Myxococcales bacterium]|nr:hypothetical protein [Myxococcales bacterium]